jgi:dipeptidyl aminopeptidase/acylaminoacyl peptidase
MNSDGTDTEVLTLGSHPSWSPDDKSIAFALWGRTAKDPTNIHLIHLDQESKIRQLTSSPEDDLDPTWSPDGKTILFTRGRTGFGNDTDIWSMNADGTGEKKLTSPESDAFWAPTWRPPLPSLRYRFELTAPTTRVAWPDDNPRWTFTTEIIGLMKEPRKKRGGSVLKSRSVEGRATRMNESP